MLVRYHVGSMCSGGAERHRDLDRPRWEGGAHL